MAQQKRPRPAFSPPRPGKNKPPAKKLTTSAVSKPTKSKSRASTTAAQKRKRKASPVAIDRSDSEGLSEADDAEDLVQDRDDSRSPSTQSEEAPVHSSPEPDLILAEVVHEKPSEDCAVSLPLIHRIMQEEWQDKAKTKLSTDAREVIGKYVETFVREAIMRSSFERKDRGGTDDGWLEVEDLERVAAQLCLDF